MREQKRETKRDMALANSDCGIDTFAIAIYVIYLFIEE